MQPETNTQSALWTWRSTKSARSRGGPFKPLLTLVLLPLPLTARGVSGHSGPLAKALRSINAADVAGHPTVPPPRLETRLEGVVIHRGLPLPSFGLGGNPEDPERDLVSGFLVMQVSKIGPSQAIPEQTGRQTVGEHGEEGI